MKKLVVFLNEVKLLKGIYLSMHKLGTNLSGSHKAMMNGSKLSMHVGSDVNKTGEINDPILSFISK